jgi:hypothetical protein
VVNLNSVSEDSIRDNLPFFAERLLAAAINADGVRVRKFGGVLEALRSPKFWRVLDSFCLRRPALAGVAVDPGCS